jgi:hypothetical protein
MTVRAKFKCRAVELYADPKGSGCVKLSPVISGSEENKKFYQYTPSGEIVLMTVNPDAMKEFDPGAEYYIDFTRAE